MKVVSVAEMKAMEQAADAGGHSYAAMMELAGHAVADVAKEMLAGIPSPEVVVLVGPGNNGGDGLVAARALAESGVTVRALLCSRQPDGDAPTSQARAAGVTLTVAGADDATATLNEWLGRAHLLLDALLGTGAARPIEGAMQAALDAARAAIAARRTVEPPATRLVDVTTLPTGAPSQAGAPPLRVLAVDCPSGLNCDTGALDPAALAADVTVTFAYPKQGHFLFPGAAATGRLIVADIHLPSALADGVPVTLAQAGEVAPLLPKRTGQSHKGTFGKALIVAGSLNYVGAAFLAGRAATRAGAGLVTMAVAGPLQPMLAAMLHEATWLLLPHNMGVLAPAAVDLLKGKLKDYRALLLGCGLGTEKPTAEFMRDLFILRTKRGAPPRIGFAIPGTGTPPAEKPEAEATPFPPLVVDADGLNLLAGLDDWPKRLPPQSILTPHPGEMARLCGVEPGDVQADRLHLARRKAQEWGHVVILKGAHTVCAAPDGRAVIQPFANPALATAGTGDVLAGTVIGLLAQGLEPFAAAVAGGYLHGLAGEWLRRDVGTAGAVAGDLLPRLPDALRYLHGLRPAL